MLQILRIVSWHNDCRLLRRRAYFADIGGFVTTTGLAKTENDVTQQASIRPLSLVPKPVNSQSGVPFRIQISEDLFTSDPRMSPPSRSGIEEPSSGIEHGFRRSDSDTVKGSRRPAAVAAVTGLVIGYLLGRFRK